MTSPSAADLHVVLGTGPAGSSLAAELVRRGHPVRTVDRSGGSPAVPGAERVAADLSDPEAARAAVEGASVVYHCVNVAYHLQVEAMPVIQRAILSAAEKAGARLVVVDTLYPYGETGGRAMTEDTPWRATSAKGRMRAELDRIYLDAHSSGRARVVLGRAADCFGPGVLNSSLGGAAFPGALTGGSVLALGDIDLPHSYSFIGDVARGLAVLGESPDADGRVWHLPTGSAPTTREVHELIAARVGHPLTVETLVVAEPWGPFDAVFMDSYRELFYQHTEPQIMDSSAFERRFGVEPTPLPDALDATIDWYREFLAR
ncbi:NAD-dependent epimerase/dehydratase family protein [Streptomyces sp. H27-D2]|uniref:NAD-dependent epimerase/dehydratase family protein n=1 Tax=Streptomyces sp. H27-D2 TaxID=3046304 RepID=UPI002DBDEA62|nr:NAD-dependent epimerase/dehydratase family protein [Streptomyces sp. H27-D2]MEC4019355.1 NAD-dependent epimerase/dehydratase family protein [Streptomyces sp. H27-D2]